MSTALAPRQEAPLAHQVEAWSPEQRDLIKRTVAQDATDDELRMFLHVAAQAGLDPLQRQVYFVKRRANVGTRENPKWESRITIQAGVDGLQARALRMPDCRGILSAVVYEKDVLVLDRKTGEVKEHTSNPFAAGRPIGAWASVLREGKTPFLAVVALHEYQDDSSFLWKGKPAVMIEKVARSTALRRAYPEAFGSIYDPAEMGKQAAVEQPEESRPALPIAPDTGRAQEVVDGELVIDPDDTAASKARAAALAAQVAAGTAPGPARPTGASAPPARAPAGRRFNPAAAAKLKVWKTQGLVTDETWGDLCRQALGAAHPGASLTDEELRLVEAVLAPPAGPPASGDDVPTDIPF